MFDDKMQQVQESILPELETSSAMRYGVSFWKNDTCIGNATAENLDILVIPTNMAFTYGVADLAFVWELTECRINPIAQMAFPTEKGEDGINCIIVSALQANDPSNVDVTLVGYALSEGEWILEPLNACPDHALVRFDSLNGMVAIGGAEIQLDAAAVWNIMTENQYRGYRLKSA